MACWGGGWNDAIITQRQKKGGREGRGDGVGEIQQVTTLVGSGGGGGDSVIMIHGRNYLLIAEGVVGMEGE